jgi:hypothetical protein
MAALPGQGKRPALLRQPCPDRANVLRFYGPLARTGQMLPHFYGSLAQQGQLSRTFTAALPGQEQRAGDEAAANSLCTKEPANLLS